MILPLYQDYTTELLEGDICEIIRLPDGNLQIEVYTPMLVMLWRWLFCPKML
jgi:hypothetical protein